MRFKALTFGMALLLTLVGSYGFFTDNRIVDAVVDASMTKTVTFPIVDTLEEATPVTQFSFVGAGGQAIASSQLVGPEFTLTQQTVITELGAFVNNINCCPVTLPLTVQIRPSINGVPDTSTVLASFTLSHDNDPLSFSYESVTVDLTLGTGSYFALFAPQGDDVGILMDAATIPFNYQAESVTLGFLTTCCSFASSLPAAVRILGRPALTEVAINIKPGSDPNSINCNDENGVIAIAILTTEDFDATTVDHTTVLFEGASETHVDKKSGEARRHEEDVDGDGDTDLVFHFRVGDTGLTCDSTEGTLSGETFDGQAIEGTDAVRMVGS